MCHESGGALALGTGHLPLGTPGTVRTLGTVPPAPHYAVVVESVRVDIWLDVACVFKTRSEAQKACRLSQVRVNGAVAKAHREVKAGDHLIIQRPLGRRQLLTVVGVATSHIARAEARLLYDDTSPKPTPEEVALRRLERLYRAAATPPTRPDRDQRRTLRRLKRGE